MVKEGNHEPVHQACTRRQFLETSVASVAGLVAVGALQMPAADTTPVHGRMSEVHFESRSRTQTGPRISSDSFVRAERCIRDDWDKTRLRTRRMWRLYFAH